MKSKDGKHLFELIKSMSKSEKRFFKLSAQKHSKEEGSIYVKLFDAIEGQKEYDEDGLKEIFKEESFIQRLPMEKYNLYKILLRVLNDYNHEFSIDYKLYEALKNARILYSKMLFDQALKILSGAKKTAIKYDKIIPLLEILEIERHCVNSLSNSDLIEIELPKIYEESLVALDLYKKTNAYIGIFKDYLIESKNYFSVRTPEESTRLRNIFEDLLNSDIESYTCIEDFYRKNNLLSYYSLASNNLEEAHRYCKAIIDKLEEHPERIIENPERYFNSSYNLIMRCDLLGKKEESDLVYSKLKQFCNKYKLKESPNLNFVIFRLDMYKVNRCIRYVEIEEGLVIIDKVEKNIKELKPALNWESEALFHYNAAYLSFIAKEYKQALKYLNKVLHINKKNFRNDVFGYARIMNLILHYELNNFDLIPYAVRSTYRFLEKSEMLNKTEKAVYKFISQRLPKVMNEKEEDWIEIFEEFKVELEEILKDPYESRTQEYFDIISWLDGKIKQKSIKEIMRSKVEITA